MKIQLDGLLLQLGNPGRHQILVFCLLTFNYVPITFNHIVMAFFGSTPPHMCTYTAYEEQTTMVSASNSTFVISKHYGKCQSTYTMSYGRNLTVNCQSDVDSAWQYTKEPWESTIVTEWDLVCEHAYIGKLATTVYFCGVMVGGLLFGYLADKFGRKPVMLMTLYTQIIIGVGTSFVKHYVLFMVMRFFQGIFMQGLQMSTFVMAMELFQPQYRGIAGALLECVWGITVVMLAGVAYLLQNWRHIQLAICLPSVLAVGYFWLVPESLRWMITKGKKKEVEELVTKVTRFNKLTYPTETMENVVAGMEREDNTEGVRQYGFKDLMSTPALRKRSLILFYLWFGVAVGYYGLTFMVTSLPGNKYMNFAIAASVEFFAYVIVVFVIRGYDRRKSLIAFFVVGAVSCITAGVLSFVSPDDPMMLRVSTGLAIFGKFGMGGVFSLTYLYSSELYPTVIRNIGMGSCAFWARFGGVAAPQILILGDFTHRSFAVIAFGIVSLIGGCLTLLLPDTLGKKLPDTIEDIENGSGYIGNDGKAYEIQKFETNEDVYV